MTLRYKAREHLVTATYGVDFAVRRRGFAMRMVGRSYGLSGLSLVLKILIPAAYPSIRSGLKIGWVFACRTLIAAELVFGVASGKGGLGWHVFESKNESDLRSCSPDC